MKPSSIWKNLRYVVVFLSGNLHYLVLAFIAGTLNTIFRALTPQIIRYTVDHLIAGAEGAKSYLLIAALAVIASAGLAAIFLYLSENWIALGSEGFLKKMRDQLYHHIQHLPYEWHVQNKTGDIISAVPTM